MERRGHLALLFGLIAGSTFAQTPAPKSTMDRLIVHGNDFVFGVKEPEGWTGDTGDAAMKYHVNIVFLPVAEPSRAADVTIRVRVNGKVDENTAEDLKFDLQQYKKDYPKAVFRDLKAPHPDYKTFSKLVYVPGDFYEYIVYVNPGPQSKIAFSVAMSKMSAPATQDELKAFESVLKSLVWLSNSAPIQK
jgi:hypothetical protein